MKTRFTTIDIVASLSEIEKFYGFRVNNVYDIDNKSYLFKLSRQRSFNRLCEGSLGVSCSKEAKAVLLLESGTRIHTTDFEWPKNQTPSSFTMKLRKHIHNRRLEWAKQLGIDRIIDFQFGTGIAAYHVILELYDKGNIVLTDYEYTILNVLRPRTENEDVKFIVRNVYPIGNVKLEQEMNTAERLREIVMAAKVGDNLRRVLNPHMIYGPAVIDHVLIGAGFGENAKIGNGFNVSEDISRLLAALEEADRLMSDTKLGNIKGYIIQKKEKKVVNGKVEGEFLAYDEFHPHLYRQHSNRPYVEFESFNKAVDDFFSKIESQKIDLKLIHQEKEALKKLENVKRDHDKRLTELEKKQDEDKMKAQLIEMNLELVDRAIVIVQSAIADQISWKEISALIQEARVQGDPVATAIKALKLDINHISMILSDPFDADNGDSTTKPCLVEINLDQSAYANAKRYYDMKRHAAKKEQKTIESSTKAYKSAEKKTKQTLKEVAVVASIKKARKVHWFEKFYWFVSSENYLAIGGRDQQQNEMIVKRYLRPGDIYVHADLHGASSIVIKNPSRAPVSPKTLNEVGTMAVCFSSAWDAKVVTSAWWVYHDQVSKTAPSGEYLTTGSFMIRGKKNFLPPCHLVMGFGLLFRLGEESVAKHKGERQFKMLTDENDSIKRPGVIDSDYPSELEEDDDLDVPLDDSDDDVDKETSDLAPVAKPPTNEAGDVESFETSREENTFPDTVIELEHVEGEQFRMRHRTVSRVSDVPEQETVVYLGDDKPVLVKQPSEKKSSFTFPQLPKKAPQLPAERPEGGATTTTAAEKPQQLKRGQKFRLKKMKERYKDQDEADRILAMQVLKPDGQPKEPKHKKGKKGKSSAAKSTNVGGNKQPAVPDTSKVVGSSSAPDPELVPTDQDKPKEPDKEASDDEQDDTKSSLEDAVTLDSLTGIPGSEDILLYSVPVCAPYSSLANYKYKVKLIPGTGKRGRAAKTAITMFQHEKTATPREKELIRSLKDQDVSRNIPGKVKMSAAQLQLKKVKKR